MPLFQIFSSYPIVLIQAPTLEAAEDYYVEQIEPFNDAPSLVSKIVCDPIIVDKHGNEID